MKLRLDLSLFLILTLLFSSLNYHNDCFSLFPELEAIEVVEKKNITGSGGGGSNKGKGGDTIYTYLPNKISVSEEVYNRKFILDSSGEMSAPYFLGVDTFSDRHELPLEEYLARMRFYDALRYKNIKIKGTNMINIDRNNDLIRYNAEYIRIYIRNNSNKFIYMYPDDSKLVSDAPDDTKVTVTGTIYHPQHTDIYTDFSLNFYKNVTDSVYGE